MLLDTVRLVETPEGVELEARVVGPVARSLAWSIDQLIRVTAYWVAAIPLVFLGETGMGLMLVFVFLAEWFYPVVFEMLNHGATPGKAALRIKVVHDDGTPISWTASVLRNLLRFADFLPLAYLVGLTSMVVDRDFRRLGDLAAGTIVVYQDPKPRATPLPEATPEPVPIALSGDEQRAIIDFAQRTPRWTSARAEELAEILAPLAGSPPQIAVRRLLGMARWLVGNR